jgi:chromosome segregation protein
MEELRTGSADASRKLAALVSAQAVRQERRTTLEVDLRRLNGEAEDVKRRNSELELERQSTKARSAELEHLQRETEDQIARCRVDAAALESELAARSREIAADRETLAAIELKLQELHVVREEAMAARGKIEVEKARLDSDLEHLERNCRDEFHAGVAELLAEIADEEWRRGYEEVSAACEDLRSRIENFGAINMRALEEYQELDQRYQFLTGQKADIEQSIADTQKAIAEINRRSVEQFDDAFRAIRENFIEVFQVLFKGGQCDLRLLDDGDPLESGIDIVAQPPGKRLQNMMLLSGGEKALTAIALLIAIFRYRPSPFCVLDEVDAPLDDANIGRFTQFIAELSRDTQFILITHNKRTMEIAETLYGVTMEEPGVSKIVSVDFRRQQAAG